MEELRRDNPGKDLLNICSEKVLRQTKRIYDAQMDGLPESVVEEYNRRSEIFLSYQGVAKEDSEIFRTDDNVIMYVGGLRQLAYFALPSTGLYDTMVSVKQAEGFETSVWTVMNGQSSDVFWAKTLLGITATTQNHESAETFKANRGGRHTIY